MYLFRKLAWFMKLEKKRYIIGIIALILVSIFNLIPPKVIGTVIDKIEAGNLTNGELFLNVGYLVFSCPCDVRTSLCLACVYFWSGI